MKLYAGTTEQFRPDARMHALPMLLDRSPHGWWFRCVADGCAGKRNLDREPAVAVELLTQPPTSSPASR